MMELTTPRSQDPAELYRWIMDFVQRFMAQQREGGGLSGGADGASGVVSAGAILWLLPDVPAGYVALSGQVLDQSSFPILYSRYGGLFNTGGEAAGTFRLPNLNDRFPKHGATGTGGAATLELGIEHLPDLALTVTDPGHTHGFSGSPHTHTVTDPEHTHTVPGTWLSDAGAVGVASGATDIRLGAGASVLPQNAATGVTINNATAAGTNATEETGVTVQLEGEGEAIPLEPPWFGMLWIVRAE